MAAKNWRRWLPDMLETLKNEGGEEHIHIAYGTIVDDIKEVSKSYKEAKLALDVGKIFFDEKDIVAYTYSWHRTSDLSASDSAVQDVYQRDFRGEISGRF